MKSLYDYLKKHKKRKKEEKKQVKLFNQQYTSTSTASGSRLSFEEMNKMIDQGFQRQPSATSRAQLNEEINRRIEQAKREVALQERKLDHKIKNFEDKWGGGYF